jgi:hypothetical protein
MDLEIVTLVSASTALVSAVVGPAVSFMVSTRQIRANVISNNRERWLEELRDSIAEYVGLLLTAGMIRQSMSQTHERVQDDHDLRKIVERIVLNKNKVMLMIDPEQNRDCELCVIVERAYQGLTRDVPEPVSVLRSDAEAITRAGREVLRAEWARVKRGV